MTEQKIEQPIPGQMESSEKDEDCQLWGTLVTKNPVRLKIWQILQLFGELNVTQISNLLKESKSTVSRHLNSMEVDKLVNRRDVESTCDGRIAPKLFSINYEITKQKCGMEQYESVPKDFMERMEFIKTEIQTNRSSIAMIGGIMKTLLPIYTEVESLIKQNTPESLAKADEIFMKYMWGEKGENITWFYFKYLTPKMNDLKYKIEEWAYKSLKDDFDPEKHEEDRLKLKAEMEEAKIEQEDPLFSKKYARLGITLPLRKIFKKNQGSK